MGKNHDMEASDWGSINLINDTLRYQEEGHPQNLNIDGIPNNSHHEKEAGESQNPVSNPWRSEQPLNDFLQHSNSRTHTDNILEKINQNTKTLDVLNADSLNQNVVDSEATVGNNQPEQPLLNELPLESCRDNEGNSFEAGFCDSPLNSDDDIQISPRRKSKSKAKKKKILKEKCRLIQKKIKKKQPKKSSRQSQNEIILYESFMEEACQDWETTKAAGLSTKGDDEEVVKRIAMNIAEEAEQRKTRNQQ